MSILIHCVRGMGCSRDSGIQKRCTSLTPASLNAVLEQGQQRRVVSPPTTHLFGNRVSRWAIGLRDPPIQG